MVWLIRIKDQRLSSQLYLDQLWGSLLSSECCGHIPDIILAGADGSIKVRR